MKGFERFFAIKRINVLLSVSAIIFGLNIIAGTVLQYYHHYEAQQLSSALQHAEKTLNTLRSKRFYHEHQTFSKKLTNISVAKLSQTIANVGMEADYIKEKKEDHEIFIDFLLLGNYSQFTSLLHYLYRKNSMLLLKKLTLAPEQNKTYQGKLKIKGLLHVLPFQ